MANTALLIERLLQFSLQHSLIGELDAYVARNTLLEEARGEYLWFLDADDKLRPGALAELQRIVRSTSPDLVLCDFEVLRERRRLSFTLPMMWYRELPREFTPAVPVSPNTLVATTTFSRGTFRFFNAWPVISSERPSE